MSRTGRFGRLPRTAPSLTNTLVAIAREQQNQRDQTLMDAWQKGGQFEGKNVTDGMVLDYWHKRLDGISVDDPLYDTYKDAITQYQYAIEESKQTAWYSQLKDPTSGDDQRMSGFYLGWAKKIPSDSEFYRVLQRDAGQYIRSAYSKQQAKQRDNSEKIYNDNLLSIENKYEKGGEQSIKLLTMLAERGYNGGMSGLEAPLALKPLGSESNIVNTTNIDELGLPSIDIMMGLVQMITPTHTTRGKGEDVSAPNPNVVFHDESGKPMTGVDIVNMLKVADPSFNGTFDLDYVKGAVTQQKVGLQKRIDLAKKTGHTTDMMQLETMLAKTNQYGDQINAWPVTQTYHELHAKLGEVMRDNSLLPAAQSRAIDNILAKIGALADDPRIASNDHLKSQLRGEATGQAGTMTVAEDMEGLKSGFQTAQSSGNSEVMATSAKRDLLRQTTEELGTGQSVLTQGYYQNAPDGSKQFVVSPGASEYGAVPAQEVLKYNNNGAGAPVTVMVPNGDGTGATPVMIVPLPIFVTAKDANGQVIKTASGKSTQVGSYFTYPGMKKPDGSPLYEYLINNADGTTRKSASPVWDDSRFKGVVNSKGAMVVDISAAVPNGDYKQNGDIGNGWYAYGVTTTGTIRANGQLKGADIAFDPATALSMTNPARVHAGPDPNTDSFSPTLAAALVATDGGSFIKGLMTNDYFVRLLDFDAHSASGQTYDYNSGQWSVPTPDQTKNYNAFVAKGQQTMALVKSAQPIMSAAANFLGGFIKDSTNHAPDGVNDKPSWWTGVNNVLPLDKLRDQGDGVLSAVYNTLLPFTNTFAPRDNKPGPRTLRIDTGIGLKLPGLNGMSTSPYTLPKVPGSTTVPTSDILPSVIQTTAPIAQPNPIGGNTGGNRLTPRIS